MDNVGVSARWKLKIEPPEESIDIEGRFLAYVSSWISSHNPRVHPDGLEGDRVWWSDHGKRIRCNACRWTEFRLFREETGGEAVDARPYFLHFTNRSIVPGESTRYHFKEELSAFEVIETLTIRKNGDAYLSKPAALLLAQATAFDKDELRKAFNERKVT